VVLAMALIGAAILGYQWTQTRYYVGVDGGTVAIFQGVQQDLGPIPLSTVFDRTDLDVDELRVYDRQRVENTISASSLEDAQQIVERLNDAVE
jgi:PPM family protein phosphatase